MSRILIVDDEDWVREELRDRISIMPHEVEEASNVEEALKVLEEVACDCVLLDMKIPCTYTGGANVRYGLNLLKRIVAMPDGPPVIVITSQGLNSHHLSTEAFENGAKGFIAKPFDNQPVEEKIQKVLVARQRLTTESDPAPVLFHGGVLVIYEHRIELNGVCVGGQRGNASIRQVIEILAGQKGGKRRKESAQNLASAINNQMSGPVISSAIKEFRHNCTTKLGCGDHDVIKTCPGGGYQLADWIEVKVGSEETPKNELHADRDKLLHQLKSKEGRKLRQLSDACAIPLVRVRRALSSLEDDKRARHEGSGSNLLYFMVKEV